MLRTKALVLVVALAACATAGSTRAVRGLRRCPSMPLSATTGWPRIALGDGFALRMPSCFQEDEHPPRYVHGGVRWHCKDATVEVLWGMWGPGNFASECHTTLARVPVMIVPPQKGEAPSVRAWYLTGTIHEPFVVASSTAGDDLALLTAIAYSGELSVPRGPNR